MDFAALGRDGLQQYDEEEEETIGDVAKNPMFSSCSSSSSSPSPSSNYSQYHKGLIPQQNVRWGSQAFDSQLKQQQQRQQHLQHQQQQQRVWLGGTFESVEEGLRSNEAEAEPAHHQQEQEPSFSQRLDLMDLSSHQTQSSNSDADAGDAAASAGCGGDGSGPSGPGGGGRCFIEKEHMFDKVVTPSDVGKLNRLVIPKQHAEKYFPLDSTINEKGLLLSFEDRNGKPWRFRYSYWNSSQSYVMTKGWSRFVKEKKLDAGDIVSFERGVGELGKDHLYIDWRHRPDAHNSSSALQPLGGLPLRHPLSLAPPPPVPLPWSRMFMPNPTPTLPNHMHFHHHLNYDRTTHDLHHHHHLLQAHHNPSNYSSYRYSYGGSGDGDGGGGGGGRSFGGYNYNVVNPGSGSVFYLRSSPSAAASQHLGVGVGVGVVQEGGDHRDVPIDSVPVVHGRAAAKRVRLFGVNLECPTPEDDPDSECDMLSSTPLPNTTIMPSSLSPHQLPLELRVYSGAPLPPTPPELPRNARQSLSFNLDI